MKPAANPARGQSLSSARRLSKAGDLSGALDLLQSLRASDPLNPEILSSLADIAKRLGMQEAAEACLREVLTYSPGDSSATVELADILANTARTEEATSLLKEAALASPQKPELWVALGNLMRTQENWTEAQTFYTEALRLKPRSIAAQSGLADILFDQRQYVEARNALNAVVKQAPKNPQLRMNRAAVLLHLGDQDQGWKDYEFRLQLPSQQVSRITSGTARLKRWNGSDLKGRPLILCAEQGLGDQIFFSSQFEAIQTLCKGSTLYADCDPRLQPLFARSFQDITFSAFTPKSENGLTTARYDWAGSQTGHVNFIEIGSLPHYLRKTGQRFGSAKLTPDTTECANWSSWLGGLGRHPKIGICWRSGKVGGLRTAHYAPTRYWATLMSKLKGDFVSVQYDPNEDEMSEISSLSGRPLHEPPQIDQRNEIDRLAALLAELDLVISAPTAVAALASAVGTPTLKMTAAGSWTALGEGTEPFRRNAQIILPDQIGDWAGGFEALSAAAQSHLDACASKP